MPAALFAVVFEEVAEAVVAVTAKTGKNRSGDRRGEDACTQIEGAGKRGFAGGAASNGKCPDRVKAGGIGRSCL